jgi:Tfp pilus assembly PilM family ATPase
MQLNIPWRGGFGRRGLRQALGCALSAAQAVLVRLARQQDGSLRVAALAQVEGLSADSPQALPQALEQALLVQRVQTRRCVLALPESVCAGGQLPWPTSLIEELLDAEVLIEAAQALHVPLNAIAYDFEPGPWPQEGLSGLCCHWIAAPLDTLAHWRRSLRVTGMRLLAVEPQEQAARRALRMIEGEAAALWRQAPQDWRFRARPQAPDDPQDQTDLASLRADTRVAQVWLQLVACGLALRCWQEDV